MADPIQYMRATLIGTALLSLLFSSLAPAEESSTYPRIRVTGEGSVSVSPDMAIVELAVQREAQTARAALDANSSAMREVLSAMQSQGIAERDLQTSGFSIQPKYVYPSPKSSGGREPPSIVGYTVRNRLTVRVREISQVGSILDQSVTLGVNEGGNITFTNDDPSAAISQARIKAVQNAIAKANTLAEAAGVKVGKLLEISEQSSAPRPMPMARAEMMSAMSADSVPVAAGENAYKVTVNIMVEIEQ